MSKIYGLLAGINEYASENVGDLAGCVNDIEKFHKYLRDTTPDKLLDLKILKNSDATRTAIIKLFKEHLSRAGQDDTVVFYFSGHGARSKSAKEFASFFPSRWDEGLVCYDSRRPGGYDLADKELAVLLAEVAKNDPHIAVIVDSCHSGSATRAPDQHKCPGAKPRHTGDAVNERSLESYADGYYARMLQRGEPLDIPPSRHILMAACERHKVAFDTPESGFFSSGLREALEASGSDISYSDLFLRCRARVRTRFYDQTPQFETYQNFNSSSGFLGRKISRSAPRSIVSYVYDRWVLNSGAVHGVPAGPDKVVEFDLYDESIPPQLVGRAIGTQVGPHETTVELVQMQADPSARYHAEMTSMPASPLPVLVEGDAALVERLKLLDTRSSGVELVFDPHEETEYLLTVQNDQLAIRRRVSGDLIHGTSGNWDQVVEYILFVLKRIANWQRTVNLQNSSTKMDKESVAFEFYQMENGDEKLRTGDEIKLEISRDSDGWKWVTGRLAANYRSEKPLHLMLLQLTEDFGIHVRYNDRIEPGADGTTSAEITLTPEGERTINFGLSDDEGDEVVDTWLLVVTKKKVDDFILGQAPIELGKLVPHRAERAVSFGERKAQKIAAANDWFTTTLRFRLIRQKEPSLH